MALTPTQALTLCMTLTLTLALALALTLTLTLMQADHCVRLALRSGTDGRDQPPRAIR